MEDNKAVFAKNLARYMEINGKSRVEVCHDLGISYYTFTDWVKGKKLPRMGKIEMLANYFGILKSDLIEEMKPSAENSEELLDKEIIERLMSLSPEELEKVDAFVQGILAMR